MAGTVRKRFGPKKLVWGAVWSVVNLIVELPNWSEESPSHVKSLSQDEAANVFSRNAIVFYRLETKFSDSSASRPLCADKNSKGRFLQAGAYTDFELFGSYARSPDKLLRDGVVAAELEHCLR